MAEDLGPLAWVAGEIRKSLDSASKSLRRSIREPGREQDTGVLRMARLPLHQATGALELVGQEGVAIVVGAMEYLVHMLVEHPERCTDDTVRVIEQASFAVNDYLSTVLTGKRVSPVALFPQYREVLELTGTERVHPADLWVYPWVWAEVARPPRQNPLTHDVALRQRWDRNVLRVVKEADSASARRLCALSVGLSAGSLQPKVASFWMLSAGFFDAISLALLPLDVYAKRAVSRVLIQYAALARGEKTVSDRLGQDLLFFCAQAAAVPRDDATQLRAVRQAWSIGDDASVRYDVVQFGRFDPVLLALARKQVEVAKEAWSGLSGGDLARLRPVADAFSHLGESLQKLYPASQSMVQSLQRAIDGVLHAAHAPSAELAMEVATSVLYVEATFDDLDLSDQQLATRMAQLGARIERAREGVRSEPLAGWMEELYRRVSDQQTMGTIVSELRVHLSEVEKRLDQFFRRPSERDQLRDVPSQLQQMRGVFSVLGLDHAAQAAVVMRDEVQRLISMDHLDDPHEFETLGANLGALGFLIDMLSYQPALAKQLFSFDTTIGELRPLMGRQTEAPEKGDGARAGGKVEGTGSLKTSVLSVEAVDAQIAAKLAALSGPTKGASPLEEFGQAATSWKGKAVRPAVVELLPDTEVIELEEDDLLAIFLEEAREVLHSGEAAVAMLDSAPGDMDQMTILRRAFHTLKGSSRMVGLSDLGTAAWAFEQVLNTWLAENREATHDMLAGTRWALKEFAHWVEEVAKGRGNSDRTAVMQSTAEVIGRGEAFVLPQRAASSARVPSAMAPLSAMDFVPIPPTEPAPLADLPLAPRVAEKVAAIEASEALPPIDFSLVLEPPGGDDSAPEVSLAPVGTASAAPVAHTEFEPELPDAVVAPVSELVAEEPLEALAFGDAPPASPAHAAPQQASESGPLDDANEFSESGRLSLVDGDEQVKVVGSLRIGLPLYNVYLNEADERSRQLSTQVEEWALQPSEQMPETAVALAHSLAGSSATVGFGALSTLARLLETALQRLHNLGRGSSEQGAALVAAVQELRRLLHQFAAGFLKSPSEEVLASLRELAFAFAPARPLTSVPAEAFADTAPEEPSVPSVDTAHAVFTEPLNSGMAPLMATPLRMQSQPPSAAEEVIDAVDAMDPELFPVFEEEAAELLPQLGAALRAWLRRPDDMAQRVSALRTLHTLKGSARLAGAMGLGERAHHMESAIEVIEQAQPSVIEGLIARHDMLQEHFDSVRAADAAWQAELKQIEQKPVDPVAYAAPDLVSADAPAASVESPPSIAAPGSQARALGPLSAAVATPPRGLGEQSVRIRTRLLDRLMTQAGEVIGTRARMEVDMSQMRGALADLTGNLDRLRHQLRDVDLQAETQMQSRLAQAKDAQQNFDPLEFDRYTRVQELTRMMAESVNDVATVQRALQKSVQAAEDDLTLQARQTRELQKGLLRTRMVEFESISERLYRVVRQASKETDKQVRLDLVGGAIEMDRSVLDRMTPAFEHLLRNCVAHGIEEAAQRERAGKDSIGQVTVELHQEGNDVSVSFRDDGSGLSRTRIVERARALGLIGPHQELDEHELADLVFRPGFSTATQISELSGRGIGMDVVRSEVTAIGGRIETRSTEGKGTEFKLVLPLTTAVTHVVMLRMGEASAGVPSTLVELVRRTTADEIQQAYADQSLVFGGERVPFFWAGALLQSSPRSLRALGKTSTVVIVRSAAQRVALHVDEVLGNQEVVVKNLGPQLMRLPGLAGVSTLASGAVALIYNPVTLAALYGDAARQWQSEDSAQNASTGHAPAVLTTIAPVVDVPLVLVVDDSITIRRVTQRLLLREGYRVVLAADGLQALERLQEERPAVVLSDIEMPRMDGFDLVRNIRADPRLAQLPVIMITSRIAEKHREHARQLGVDHYLGKPYPEEELLRLVQELTQVETR